MLSSYSTAIQNQEKMIGSLFQQRTKAKQVSSEWLWEDYSVFCFRYILNNPAAARLVSNPLDWEYSSYKDLVGQRNGTLCNQQLIRGELNVEWDALEGLVNMPLTVAETRLLF